MKLALFVHDFRIEVGHSNSLIELIRHLPESRKKQIENLTVVSYIASDLEKLFPEFSGKIHWHKVPFSNIQPSILKSLFFQLWTFFYNLFYLRDFYKIGIGICCLSVDAVSIQFIHQQWTKPGLQLERQFWLRLIYKKVLFYYYELCENIIFQSKKIKFFTPAKFLENFLTDKYRGINCKTIYSGINLERFKIPIDRIHVLQQLLVKHPQLKNLDLGKPIYLFVGAYERKGLHDALEILSKENDAQFVVVGSPSFGRTVKWPSNINLFKVDFSKEIESFYALSDVFLFPTIYEPFGLVLFEAMAMGLTIITKKENVGASELLGNLPGIYFLDSENFRLPDVNVKSQEEKIQLAKERMDLLPDVTWSKAGNELEKFLF